MRDKLNEIRKVYAHHFYLSTGKQVSDDDFETYIREQYTPIQWHIIDENNFFTYKDCEKYYWIQDFCSDNIRHMYRMLSQLDIFDKKIRFQMAMTNFLSLNIVMRKKFRIKAIEDYSYILER